MPIRFALVISLVTSHSILGYRIFANGLHEECGIALFLTGGKGVAKIVGDPVWERAVNSTRTNLGILDFNESRLSWKNQIQRSLLKFALNKFSSVITPGEELKSLVKKWDIKPKIIWVPNGVSIKPEMNMVKTIDIITVSRLVPWKNIEVLVSAAKEFGFSLCVVGDGPELENLIALCPNCHARFDQKKEIDRLAVKMYKHNLSILNNRYGEFERRLFEVLAKSGERVFVLGVAGDLLVANAAKDGFFEDKHDPGINFEVKSDDGSSKIFAMTYKYWVTDAGVEFIKRFANGDDIA